MTATRETTPKPIAVAQAEKQASIPKRQVIQHTQLFRAELQVRLNKANGQLAEADLALANAEADRDAAIELANQKYDAIRAEVDAERQDIITAITGIETALTATSPKADTMAQVEKGEGE